MSYLLAFRARSNGMRRCAIKRRTDRRDSETKLHLKKFQVRSEHCTSTCVPLLLLL